MTNIGSFRSVNALSKSETQKQSSPKQAAFGMRTEKAGQIVQSLAEIIETNPDLKKHCVNPGFRLVHMINTSAFIVKEEMKQAVLLLAEQLAKSNAELRPLFSKNNPEFSSNLNFQDAERTIGEAVNEYYLDKKPKEVVERHFERISDTTKYPDPEFPI